MRRHPDSDKRSHDDGRYGEDGYYVSQSSGNGGHGRRKGPISSLVRGVAAGIGLASESYHHHQEKKREREQSAISAASVEGESSTAGGLAEAANSQQSSLQSSDKGKDAVGHTIADDLSEDSNESDENIHQEAAYELDEAAWQLDDAQMELAPPPDYATVMEQDVDDMAQEFLSRHRILEKQQPQQRQLPVPAIIPQRRPGERARGFIRAYPPLLGEVGIDQQTFMDFIKELNAATMPSPWINAINVASIAVQHVPEPVTIAVSIAAQIATQVGLQAHSRSKTNTFLNKINADYFRPLGLIAVILTWKPSRPGEVVTQARFDETLDTAAGNLSEPLPGASHNISNRMQSSHATTNFEWPESAPLVFPDLDKLADTAQGQDMVKATAEKKPNSMARGMIFAMEYMDKRTQAKWAADHSGSGLANLGVKPEFQSRYSDPNHPASSGSLVALLTGGALGGRVSERKQARRERHAARRERRNEWKTERRAKKGPTILGTVGPFALIRSVKKFIHEDVLYLMIANLPSSEQMAAAQEFIAAQPTQDAFA